MGVFDSNVFYNTVFDQEPVGPPPPNQPVFFAGTLCVDNAGAITGYSQGLPVTSDGRIAVTVDGVTAYVVNDVPFTSAGRVAVSGGTVWIMSFMFDYEVGGTIAGHFCGMPVE